LRRAASTSSLSGGHNAISNRRGGELPGHKIDGCR
jgi:hypothetical protein